MIPAHIVRVLAILQASYPHAYSNMSPEALGMFSMLLCGIPAEDLERAAIHHVTSSKWPPSPAELFALASNEPELSAPLAWETLFDEDGPPATEAQIRAVRICGGYDAMEEIARRREYGPVANRKRYTARDESILYKRFCDAYNAVAAEITHAQGRNRSTNLVAKLSGTREIAP